MTKPVNFKECYIESYETTHGKPFESHNTIDLFVKKITVHNKFPYAAVVGDNSILWRQWCNSETKSYCNETTITFKGTTFVFDTILEDTPKSIQLFCENNEYFAVIDGVKYYPKGT